MRIVQSVFGACFLVMIVAASAQVPAQDTAAAVQEQIGLAGQQLQEKAVSHLLEGNLTQEHIAQDLNSTLENLTDHAKARVNDEINQSLNLTPEQIKQKTEEELKKRLSQEIQKQPGFEAAIAVLALLGAVGLLRRKD
jgi:PGF-CTERM protein